MVVLKIRMITIYKRSIVWMNIVPKMLVQNPWRIVVRHCPRNHQVNRHEPGRNEFYQLSDLRRMKANQYRHNSLSVVRRYQCLSVICHTTTSRSATICLMYDCKMRCKTYSINKITSAYHPQSFQQSHIHSSHPWNPVIIWPFFGMLSEYYRTERRVVEWNRSWKLHSPGKTRWSIKPWKHNFSACENKYKDISII